MIPPTLFVTVGAPGSGKTTMSKLLADQGVAYLSRTKIREEFGMYSPRKRSQVMRVLEGYTKGYLLNNKSVVVDANHVSVDQRAEVLLWAKELWLNYGKEIRKVCLFFPTDLAVCLARRKEDIDNGSISTKVIKKQHRDIVPPSHLEGCHVYTVDSKVTNPVDLLQGRIRPFESVSFLHHRMVATKSFSVPHPEEPNIQSWPRENEQ